MEFIDLKSQQQRLRQDIEARIHQVLDHGKYIMGPEIAELEKNLARYAGVKHCLAVSSGTDALLLAMMALSISPGDEIITTPFSFFATAETILLLGAVPVFVDIDPTTYNINPQLIENAITSKTRAILPVSLYGQCADMESINTIAQRYHLPVIEDAAQSFGALYHGKKSCALSTLACTSFFPSKPLGGYGDSGACLTDDDHLAEKIRCLRDHGQTVKYQHSLVGINGRMDTLQAAILLSKLSIFDDEIRLRQSIATHYQECFAAAKQSQALTDQQLQLPHIMPDQTSVYAQYTIAVPERAQLQQALTQQGIPTAVHYPHPMYQQMAMENRMRCVGTMTYCESASARVLSLPMHPYLQRPEIERVVAAVIAGIKAQ